jgi:hypothetical protein
VEGCNFVSVSHKRVANTEGSFFDIYFLSPSPSKVPFGDLGAKFKTMKKYLFLLTLFSCLMASCVKDPPTTFEATVKGRVLEVDSEVGIPNITVKLVEEDYALSGSSKRTTLQTVKTDAQGNYQFTYTRQKILNYDVVAVNSSPDYNEYTQAVLIPDGESNVVNIFLNPFGWVKVHVKNVNPFDERDEVKFYYGTFYGTKVDSTFLVKSTANKKYVNTIYIQTTRNSIRSLKEVGLIIPPRDTTLFNVFY